MTIETLFDRKRDIRRTIEKVITFGAAQEERLRAEIEEYEVTPAIDDGMQKLFEGMQAAMTYGGPNDIGVWISGYYGSGKSSFAKYLGLALDDGVMVDGQPFRTKLAARLTSPQSTALLNAVASRFPAAVVMVDLASEMVAGHTMEDVSTVLYYKVLQWAGYSRNLKVAALEKRLRQDGRYEELRTLFREELGAEWEDFHNDPLIVDDLLPKYAHRLYSHLFSTESSFSTKADDTILLERERVEEMLKLVREHSGKEYVIFVVDEVGQYVAARDELILNLDGLAKNLKEVGDGKVWILATAQQTLTEDSRKAAINSPELFKLAARYPIKVDLPSSDIRLISTRRLLGKSVEGRDQLKQMYSKLYGEALRHNTKLEDAPFYDSDLNEQTFVDLYPFLPAHFEMLLYLLGVLAKTTGGLGLRSALKVVQDTLLTSTDGGKPLAEQPIGTLATAATLYDILKGDILRTNPERVKNVETVSRIFKNSAIHHNVAKAVAVLQILTNLPITVQNVAAVLHPSVSAQSQSEAVRKAIDDLCARDEIPFGLQDGRYRFFSEAINEIERERTQMPVLEIEQRSVRSKALSALFTPMPTAQAFQNRSVSAGVSIDTGGQVVSILGEREQIKFLLHLVDASTYDTLLNTDTRNSVERENQSTIYLIARTGEEPFGRVREIAQSRKIVDKYRNDTNQEVRDYCRGLEQGIEVNTRMLQQTLEQDLMRGSFVFRGSKTAVNEHGIGIAAATKLVLAATGQAVYDRYLEAPARTETGTAKAFLNASNLAAIASKDDPLGLVQKTGGEHGINREHKAIVSIRDYLNSHGTVEGNRLLSYFSDPPFGWSQDTVRYIIAAMLRASEIKLTVAGHELTVTGQQAIDALATNQSFKNVGVSPRGDTKPPNEYLGRSSARLTQLLGKRVLALEDDIAKAARDYLPQAQRDYAPMGRLLDSLDVAGSELISVLSDTITGIILTDASGAWKEFGAPESALDTNLRLLRDIKRALENGLESTLRQLREVRREVADLPDSGRPAALRADLTETLAHVEGWLHLEILVDHAADLKSALATIQSEVAQCADAMRAEYQEEAQRAKQSLLDVMKSAGLESGERNPYLNELDELPMPATGARPREILNANFVLREHTAHLEATVTRKAEADRIRRMQEAAQAGKRILQEEVTAHSPITNRADLEALIERLQEIASKLDGADEIVVRLTLD